MSEYFVVEFDGFYAEKQPNYDWSFTYNVEDAKLYKTLKAANERGEWGLKLKKYGKKYRLVKVEIITAIKGSDDWISTEIIATRQALVQLKEKANREVISLNKIRPCKQ